MSCRGLNHYFFHIFLLSKTEDVNVAGERPQIYSYATTQGILLHSLIPLFIGLHTQALLWIISKLYLHGR